MANVKSFKVNNIDASINASGINLNSIDGLDSSNVQEAIEELNDNIDEQDIFINGDFEVRYDLTLDNIDTSNITDITDTGVANTILLSDGTTTEFSNYSTYTIDLFDSNKNAGAMWYIQGKTDDSNGFNSTVSDDFAQILLIRKNDNHIVKNIRISNGSQTFVIQMRNTYGYIFKLSFKGVKSIIYSNNIVHNIITSSEIDTIDTFIENQTFVNSDYFGVRADITLDGVENVIDITDASTAGVVLSSDGSISSNTYWNIWNIDLYDNNLNASYIHYVELSLKDSYTFQSGLVLQFVNGIVLYRKSDDSVVTYKQFINGTNKIVFYLRNDDTYYIKLCYINYQVSSVKWATSCTNKITNNTADITSIQSAINYWKDKKIAWYGTSIPAHGYPANCGGYLGATVYNKAIGASMARAGRKVHDASNPLGDVYGVTGVAWQNINYSLTLSQAEKHDIFINWTTADRQANLIAAGYTSDEVADVVGYSNLMGGAFYGNETDETQISSPSSKPTDIMADNYADYRKLCYGCSWDNSTDIEDGFGDILGRVEQYLDWDNTVDLWVFEHGHNDNLSSDSDDDYLTVPSDDPYDRWTFLGAMNFLIDKIYSFNPRARIMIVGHYESTTSNYERICKAQQVLADYWNVPIYKLWENTQMAKGRTITTNAYWDTDGVWHDSGFDGTNGSTSTYFDGVDENIRQLEDGTWVHDMSMLRVWMLDALHPGSTEAKDYLGRLISLYIRNNV